MEKGERKGKELCGEDGFWIDRRGERREVVP